MIRTPSIVLTSTHVQTKAKQTAKPNIEARSYPTNGSRHVANPESTKGEKELILTQSIVTTPKNV